MSLILVITDNPATESFLREQLKLPEFDLIFTGVHTSDFSSFCQNPVSLILTDLRPAQNFKLIYSQVRQACAAPFLAVISRGHEDLIAEQLNAGAADCIVKPLRGAELMARIQALSSRFDSGEDLLSEWICSGLKVNLVKHRAYKGGAEIKATRIGFRILLYMMQHKGRVVTKEELLHEVWGYSEGHGDNNLVESAIRRLRMDIEDDPRNPECLHTIWGIGYRFEERP